MLEIASGTGEHAVHFAERFPALEWQPSDIHPDALASIARVARGCGLANVREPIVLDAAAADWPIDRADAVLSINMVHISPWTSALGLLDGAARLLRAGGPLILYGPWLKDDVPTAPSNLEFDADLRRRNPDWGLRQGRGLRRAPPRARLRLVETRRDAGEQHDAAFAPPLASGGPAALFLAAGPSARRQEFDSARGDRLKEIP